MDMCVYIYIYIYIYIYVYIYTHTVILFNMFIIRVPRGLHRGVLGAGGLNLRLRGPDDRGPEMNLLI